MKELKDYDIMDIEAMDDERLEKSESSKIQVTRVYIKSDVDAAIAELKAKNRRLKRALWIARSYRGRDNSILLPSKFMRNVWDNVERKCLKKAEEYK